MKLLLKYLIVLLLFPAADCTGQLRDADTLPVRLDLNLKGNLLAGNLERYIVIAGGDLYLNGEHWSFGSHTTYQYGNFGDFPTERDLFSRNFVYLNRLSTLYPFAMAWFETNKRRRFDLRWQAGAGFTVRVLSTEAHLLKLSGMFSREETSYLADRFSDSGFDGKSRVELWRSTARLWGSHRISGWQLNYEAWVQLAVNSIDIGRTYLNISMEHKVSQRVSLGVSLNHYREQLVVLGVKQGDLFMNLGFRWSTSGS